MTKRHVARTALEEFLLLEPLPDLVTKGPCLRAAAVWTEQAPQAAKEAEQSCSVASCEVTYRAQQATSQAGDRLAALCGLGQVEEHHVAEGLAILPGRWDKDQLSAEHLLEIVVKNYGWFLNAGHCPLGDLLPHVSSKLATLQLVAQENVGVGFDHRLNILLCNLGLCQAPL